ncbi:MAG: hypothetical protein ACRD3W_22080 [Terriglobales bacterium]
MPEDDDEMHSDFEKQLLDELKSGAGKKVDQSALGDSYCESVIRRPDGAFIIDFTHWHDGEVDCGTILITLENGDEYAHFLKLFPDLEPGKAKGFSGKIEDAPSRQQRT